MDPKTRSTAGRMVPCLTAWGSGPVGRVKLSPGASINEGTGLAAPAASSSGGSHPSPTVTALGGNPIGTGRGCCGPGNPSSWRPTHWLPHPGPASRRSPPAGRASSARPRRAALGCRQLRHGPGDRTCVVVHDGEQERILVGQVDVEGPLLAPASRRRSSMVRSDDAVRARHCQPTSIRRRRRPARMASVNVGTA